MRTGILREKKHKSSLDLLFNLINVGRFCIKIKKVDKVVRRLTRMLINAMEVTGIEGTYRSTCESTMEVNKIITNITEN
jgi:phosphatidylinositol kinase/protein kinase (PI-3  family)